METISRFKFRVWSGEQMVSPDYINRGGLAFWKENSIPSSSMNVMQYTGLKDKNGKEIYEGDILCWPKYEGSKNETRWAVEWDNKRARWSDWSPREDAEIIGNIYENPELLPKTN